MKKLLMTLMVLLFSVAVTFALDLKVKDKNLSDTAEMKQMNISLKAVQNKYGPIVFVTGKADIDVAKCKTTLNTIVTIIKKYPRFLVTVEGHTDNVGNKKSNLALSQKRAEAVVAWLVKSGGVAAKQLKAKGYGDSKPIESNKTEKGRAKNRRVDFEVSKL
ncbi:MAG: OmpA family protein [Spirochaetae bacterium HGW-Spirochaetae-1]|jgi:outer membrane protein OmpA-like peptidoglycan-associated protein|nr:MAG: OmpA family protein [Spirochaetae bacterium HGW-Spirochaetae-1]